MIHAHPANAVAFFDADHGSQVRSTAFAKADGLNQRRVPAFPYRFDGFQNVPTGDLRAPGDTLSAGERYRAVLRILETALAATRQAGQMGEVKSWFLYLFAFDGAGRGTLLFPALTAGSVENRVQLGEATRGEDEGFPATWSITRISIPSALAGSHGEPRSEGACARHSRPRCLRAAAPSSRRGLRGLRPGSVLPARSA